MLIAESFAKINRSLLVLGKRPDGFHELRTLFQTVDLTDSLTFEEAPALVLTCSDPRLACDGTNLVMKAARALRETAGVERGTRIHLEKRIPWGGGLGGGSGNAAATLIALNELWGLGFSHAALSRLAAGLGSDINFFLHGGCAIGVGRGEEIIEKEDPRESALLLVFPSFSLATPAVFSALCAPQLTEGLRETNLPSFMEGEFPDRNDLETAAESLRPELRAFREALLEAGATTARLSGSGSTLFGEFETAIRAETGRHRLESRFRDVRCRVTRTVGREEFWRRAFPHPSP